MQTSATWIVAALTALGVMWWFAFSSEPVRDVRFFLSHPAEMQNQLVACQRGPGMAMTDTCQNAFHGALVRIVGGTNP